MALSNPPLILTERLELRVPVADDRATLAAIVAHEDTRRFLGAASNAATHFERFSRNAGSWLLYGYGAFTVRLRESGEIIGNCGVFHTWRGLGEDFDDSPEAGWILRHDQVGRGLGREVMTAILAWFDATHGARRIVCMTSPENEASIALAGKLGFTPMREDALPDGEAVLLLERVP